MDECLAYRSELKNGNGFRRKCGHGNSCESVPANSPAQVATIRRRLRPTCCFIWSSSNLVKAMHIVYFVATKKKGINATELSRKLDLRQKSRWFLKRRVMKIMKSPGDHHIVGTAKVDETASILFFFLL